jgi:hypothetical protein
MLLLPPATNETNRELSDLESFTTQVPQKKHLQNSKTESEKINIYQNPDDDSLIIITNFDPQEITLVKVFDRSGQLVYQQSGLSDNTINPHCAPFSLA